MTKAEKDKLRKHILEDKRFRTRFLADPAAAAATIGVTLTAAEARKFRATRATIRKNAAAYDNVRQHFKIGQPIKPTFLPLLPVLM